MLKKIIILGILMILGSSLSANYQWNIQSIGSATDQLMLFGISLGDGNNDGENELYTVAVPRLVRENQNSIEKMGWTYPNHINIIRDYINLVYQYKYTGNNWEITGMDENPHNEWHFDVCSADGNNNGQVEVYATEFICPTNGVHQFEWDGLSWNKTLVGANGAITVDCGDGDNNNYNEIYCCHAGNIYRFEWIEDHWSQSELDEIPGLNAFSLAIGDADNDGQEEVYAGFQRSDNNTEYEIYCYRWNGTSWDYELVDDVVDCHSHGLAIGDGNNDGENELYTTTYSGGTYQFKWDGNNWDRTLVWDEGHELTRMAVGDGDNNGTTELYVADFGVIGPPPTGGHLFKYEWNGNEWIRIDIGEISIGETCGSVNDVCIDDGNNNGLNEVYCTMASYIFKCFWADTTAIIGDFNYDGYVDAADLQLLGDHWHFVDTGPGWDALYDLVPDGIIDAADLQVFGDHWHEGTPPPKSGEGGKDGKGPNADAGIVFDLDVTTIGNQNLTSIPSQPAGTHIKVDVYCTDVVNLDTYEFEVIYNPTELTYVAAFDTSPITYEPNILTTNGGTALGWMVDSSTPGVLSIAYTLAGCDPLEAPEGEGLIAHIVFLSLVDTYGTLSFGDVQYYDTYGVMDIITNTGTATLPVELTSFTAIYNTVSGFVSLCWATASETDVNGFNIYRNTEDSFVEADKINIDLIEGSGTTTVNSEYSFVDETADPYYTTYYYWLEVINFGGTSDVHGSFKYIPIDVNNNGELDIITSILSPCYPNPVRIGNEIKFNFRVGGLEGTARNVELKVYNILGKLVAEVVNGELLVNDYTETWKPENLSNGVYFYQLKTDNYSEVKKMMIQ